MERWRAITIAGRVQEDDGGTAAIHSDLEKGAGNCHGIIDGHEEVVSGRHSLRCAHGLVGFLVLLPAV